jgi:signal transduction histidine kinase
MGEGRRGQSRGRTSQPDRLGREALGAWGEVEALLRELLERSGLEAEPAAGGAGEGSEEDDPTVVEVLTRCRNRLAAVRDSASRLEQRLAELQGQQDELLGIVAHDLRTPLVAIQGFAQLLRSVGGLGEKQQRYVDRIFQAVRTMNRMVEDLRTARGLAEGRLCLESRAVDFGVLAQDLVGMHREEALQKGVGLRLEAPAGLPRTLCDPERLGQALGKLVENAIRVSPPGGTVTLRVAPGQGVVRWEVLDGGPGLDEELLPLIFQRCARDRATGGGEAKGFGLGLHVCREIVALHGGRVGAHNEPAGGSCFWAEVPLTRAPEEGGEEPGPKGGRR